MKKNNKGFSLVELIVVLAIMAVLTGSVVTYIGTYGSTKVKNCMREIENHMSETKVCAMSKTSAYMIIYANNTGVYVTSVQGSLKETDKVGEKGLKVTYASQRSRNSYTAVGETETTGLKIEYDRASGALKKNADGKYDVYAIQISNGNSTHTIEIEPVTGKTSMN